MGWIQTGLEYQAFHTLAILVWRWQCSVASVSGFTGVAFSRVRHGAVQRQPLLPGTVPSALWAFVTPVGGVSFLAGWALS